MSVAYILMAHTAPGQVARLVTRLADERVSFFVHIDRKASRAIRRQFAARLSHLADCRWLDSRRVHWAHFSQIDVTLRGLEAIERSGLDPEHTVLITGQHYPIKPRSEIARRLRDPNVSFMRYSPLPNYQSWPADGGLDRFQRVHLWTPRGRMFVLPIRRTLPSRYQPFGGSAYWSLGRTHRRYVLDAVHRDGELVRCFRHSRAGDEVFFQTILMSSSVGESVVNDSLVFVKWKAPATRPAILTSEDFGAIAASNALFARKFDHTVDDRVLDLIDDGLLR